MKNNFIKREEQEKAGGKKPKLPCLKIEFYERTPENDYKKIG